MTSLLCCDMHPPPTVAQALILLRLYLPRIREHFNLANQFILNQQGFKSSLPCQTQTATCPWPQTQTSTLLVQPQSAVMKLVTHFLKVACSLLFRTILCIILTVSFLFFCSVSTVFPQWFSHFQLWESILSVLVLSDSLEESDLISAG